MKAHGVELGFGRMISADIIRFFKYKAYEIRGIHPLFRKKGEEETGLIDRPTN